jgi:glucose/arabinose dehydrogenase
MLPARLKPKAKEWEKVMRTMRKPLTVAWIMILLAGCSGANDATSDVANAQGTTVSNASFTAVAVAKFNQPWAMTFLPDGRLLVTERKGALKLHTLNGPAGKGATGDISGVPDVDYGGQGGLGDVVLHPSFNDNHLMYLSYAEAGPHNTRGAAVARATLTLNDKGAGALSNVEVIWRQVPKVTGSGHYGHRIAFGPDGHLWISSGERQKFDPAQDLQSNLGKIVRLNDDGSIPPDNPFADKGGVTAQIWSLGHRNPLGLVFDAQGRLWNQEMGPQGGDEVNLVERGANYGYPIVSNGDHYDGRVIPDHNTRPEFKAPAISWNPVISPAGFMIYSGSEFPAWRGSGFIGGLSSKSLVRIEFDGNTVREAERFAMGQRIREVEQGPDGAVWLLEDEKDGGGGRLLKLTRRR